MQWQFKAKMIIELATQILTWRFYYLKDVLKCTGNFMDFDDAIYSVWLASELCEENEKAFVRLCFHKNENQNLINKTIKKINNYCKFNEDMPEDVMAVMPIQTIRYHIIRAYYRLTGTVIM